MTVTYMTDNSASTIFQSQAVHRRRHLVHVDLKIHRLNELKVIVRIQEILLVTKFKEVQG